MFSLFCSSPLYPTFVFLNSTIGRPDDFDEKERVLNVKHRNDCCGKYCLQCVPSYRHRQWIIWLVGVSLCITSLLIIVFAVQPRKTDTLVILGVIGAIILAFANGANDIANSMGTSVGANALTLKQALVLGSIFEAMGAITMGSSVAKTISKGVIDPNAYNDDGCEGTATFALGMLCVLAGAGVTTLLATMYGLPISATHSIVGGLVAVGLAARGAASLGMAAIVKTLVAWVASPLVGAFTAGLLHVVIAKLIFGAENPEKRSKKMRPLFVAVAVAVCSCFILMKGPSFMKIKDIGIAVLVGISIGIFCAIIVIIYERSKIGRSAGSSGDAANGDGGDVEIVDQVGDESKNDKIDMKDGSGQQQQNGGDDGTGGDDSAGGDEVVVEVDVMDEASRQAKLREGAEKPFVPLLVLSALVVAFAHGGNDVGNAIGPLAVIVEAVDKGRVAGTPEIPMWSLVIGAIGFVVGIALLGERTIGTVGGKITKLTPTKSFATQMGAAAAVLTSSVLGLPVSTSHCLVGAVVGIGCADRCMEGSGGINFSVLKKIFVGWAVTIPLAMLVSVIMFWAMFPSFFPNGKMVSGSGANNATLTNGTTLECLM